MTVPTKPLRAAFVGTTHPHSRMYYETLSQFDEIEITLVVGERGDYVNEGTPHVPSLNDVPSDASFDAAFLFLPNHETAAACRTLLNRGKHVFCEKPVARTSDDVEELVRLASQGGLTFLSGYQWRVHPIARFVRELVADGSLGEIYSVEGRMITSTVEARDPSHWIFDNKQSGGGIVHWLGCHHIDLLRFLVGDEIVETTAMTRIVTAAPIDVEDLAAALIRFKNGAIGTLHQGYLIPEETDNPFARSSYDTFLGLRGSLGWMRWEATTSSIEVYSLAQGWRGAAYRRIDFDVEKRPGYGVAGYELIRHFLHCVRTGEPTLSDARNAMQNLRVIEAIYRSADRRSAERVVTGPRAGDDNAAPQD